MLMDSENVFITLVTGQIRENLGKQSEYVMFIHWDEM